MYIIGRGRYAKETYPDRSPTIGLLTAPASAWAQGLGPLTLHAGAPGAVAVEATISCCGVRPSP